MNTEKNINKGKKARGSTFGDIIRTLFLGGRHAKIKNLSIMEEEQMQSPYRTMLTNFWSKRTARIGMFTFTSILILCFVLPIWYPYDTAFQDPSQQNVPPTFSLMSVPKELQGNAKQISVGSRFSAGIDNEGKVYIWGDLSDNGGKLRKIPENMGPLKQIACGRDHIIALSEDNKVYVWGYNRLNVDKIPMEVQNADIVKVTAGYQYSAALDKDGNLYTWGNEAIINISLTGLSNKVKDIVLSIDTGIALLKDNTVLCLSKKEMPQHNVPGEVQGNAVAITATDKAVLALTKDGRVYAWGTLNYGLGDIPEEIQGHVKTIASGRNHFVALLDDGSIRAWGDNKYGQSKAPVLSNVEKIGSGSYQNYAIDKDGKVNTWGLRSYIMGTDQYGRDMFSRLLSGGKVSLTVGFLSVIISSILGIIIGGLAGYFGGKTDMFLMRLGEVFNSIPWIPLAMLLSALIGNSMTSTQRVVMIMIILGFLNWPYLSRIVRGQILAEREKEFVTAAKAMGISEMRITFRHIVPNVISIALVNITLSFATCMLSESALSYLGFGITEPNASWGQMLNGCNNSTVLAMNWWRWVFPALVLSFCVISINMMGDAMRDAVDPKSNDR